MEEEIIIVIDPDPPSPGGRNAAGGWSVRFICNGEPSADGLRAAKRAIKRRLEELAGTIDEE